VWQREPRVFKSPSKLARPIPEQTWADCCDMLTLAAGLAPGKPPAGCELLVMKGMQPTQEYDDVGPCAALLDGGSCVVNHAEFVWPPLTRLCRELRQSLLHVYANCYVTPPGSQAVAPHADDRDVFVLQLCGRKRWRIFGPPPVQLPYTHEQVGKNGFDVPEECLAQTPIIECVLEAGDVLYMPRGFIHEASCPDDASSWHATLAVATHDWSWTKVVGSVLTSAMDRAATGRWRRALPLAGQDLAAIDLEALLDAMRQSVSVQSLRENLTSRTAPHNINQEKAIALFEQVYSGLPEHEDDINDSEAHWKACLIRPETRVRKTTQAEKNELAKANGEEKRSGAALAVSRKTKLKRKISGRGKKGTGGSGGGLTVREELADTVIAILAELGRKADEGMVVREFGRAAADVEGSVGFDELLQVCFARVCAVNGALRIIGAERKRRKTCAEVAASA